MLSVKKVVRGVSLGLLGLGIGVVVVASDRVKEEASKHVVLQVMGA